MRDFAIIENNIVTNICSYEKYEVNNKDNYILIPYGIELQIGDRYDGSFFYRNDTVIVPKLEELFIEYVNLSTELVNNLYKNLKRQEVS